jgi:hypothetical protein
MSILRRMVLGGMLVIFLAVAGRYSYREMMGPDNSVRTEAVRRPLRLTGKQFLSNWQSFPRRRVTIEYCTVQVGDDGQIRCHVLDGSKDAGFISVDRASLDPKSLSWAEANCATATLGRICTSRLSGTIQKGADGRPMILDGALEP